MKNNTNFLNLIRDLGETELELDRKLNDSMKAIFVDEDDEKKRHILEEKLKIKKVGTADNPADILTKALAQDIMSKHLRKLGFEISATRSDVIPELQ